MAAAMLRRTDWLALAVAGLTGACLLTFTLLNPEGLVAERNVDRFRDRGKIDVAYLGQLSADATPALAALPRDRATCAVVDQAESLRNEDGSFGLNVARARARRTIADLSEQPSRAVC